jgi:hypothetical protein
MALERSAVTMHGNTVRVVIPAAVAYDLGRFQATLKNLAERLGCLPCLSGATCQFLLEKDFLVDPAGKITPILPGELESGGFGG